MLKVRCNYSNGVGNPKKKKIVEKRKEELKGIFKQFEELSKKEIERSKSLFNDHKMFFENQQPSAEVVVLEEQESFFTKN